MCESCKWKSAVTKLNKLLKGRKKDFIAGFLTGMKNKIQKQKHCTKKMYKTINGLVDMRLDGKKIRRKSKKK